MADEVYEVRTPSAANYVTRVVMVMAFAGEAVLFAFSGAVVLAIPVAGFACFLVMLSIYGMFYAPFQAVLTDEGIRFDAKARQIFVRWGDLDAVRRWNRATGARTALTFQTFSGRSIRMSPRIHGLHHMLVEVEHRSPRAKITY